MLCVKTCAQGTGVVCCQHGDRAWAKFQAQMKQERVQKKTKADVGGGGGIIHQRGALTVQLLSSEVSGKAQKNIEGMVLPYFVMHCSVSEKLPWPVKFLLRSLFHFLHRYIFVMVINVKVTKTSVDRAKAPCILGKVPFQKV